MKLPHPRGKERAFSGMSFPRSAEEESPHQNMSRIVVNPHSLCFGHFAMTPRLPSSNKFPAEACTYQRGWQLGRCICRIPPREASRNA
eukprot:6037427-Pyramimonas_sp.AAC.1